MIAAHWIDLCSPLGDPVQRRFPDGSVDLFWKSDAYELLVHVPATGTATYYGDDLGDLTVEGSTGEKLRLWIEQVL